MTPENEDMTPAEQLHEAVQCIGMLIQNTIQHEQVLLQCYEAIEAARDLARSADEREAFAAIGDIRREISSWLKPMRKFEVELNRLRDFVCLMIKNRLLKVIKSRKEGGAREPERSWLDEFGELPVTVEELKRICSENPFLTDQDSHDPRHQVSNRCGDGLVISSDELAKTNHGQLYALLFGHISQHHPKRKFFSMGFANENIS